MLVCHNCNAVISLNREDVLGLIESANSSEDGIGKITKKCNECGNEFIIGVDKTNQPSYLKDLTKENENKIKSESEKRYWLLYSLISYTETHFLTDNNVGDEFGALQAKLENLISDKFWNDHDHEHAHLEEIVRELFP